MPEFRVRWEIDLEAEDAAAAARYARAVMLDPTSWATVFDVKDAAGVVVSVDVDDAGEVTSVRPDAPGEPERSGP